MNCLNEGNLGTAPDNPVWATSTTLLLPLGEKTRSDTEQFRKFYGTYHKSVAADPVLYSTLPTKYTSYTVLIAQIQIQRECSLFIRGFSI